MTSKWLRLVFGADARTRRQVSYWAITLGLYAVCMLLLALEVRSGRAGAARASWLMVGLATGTVLFYLPVRASARLNLSPSVLAIAQAVFAIAGVVAAYATVGPARGATLAILVVVLVFCAFALTPRQAYAMSLFAILLLGLASLLMSRVEPDRYAPDQESVHFALAASMLAAVAYLTGQLSLLRQKLKAQKDEIELAMLRIQELATRDDLTLLVNRRHMNDLLAYERQRHDRKGRSMCLAMLDIDWFKRVNDTHGHAAGDQVLRGFAQQALAAVRGTDVLARWGGEEFLLMLPDTEPQAAAMVLARIQARLAATHLSAGEAALQITFSAGLTVSQAGESVAESIARADAALYAAKAAGRNRVVTQ